jgi:hypothetical protein
MKEREKLMILKSRTLSLNNVVSLTMGIREGDELLDIIDGTADYFRQVLVNNGYYTTAPVVFRGDPGSREFTLMTSLGNRVNLVGDEGTGFEFHEHVKVESDFFYRHWAVDEPVPYAEIGAAVAESGSKVRSFYHVILDFYGEVVLDVYVDAENR